MLVNSNYTVGQYFLAYSIINSVSNKRNYKLNIYMPIFMTFITLLIFFIHLYYNF